MTPCCAIAKILRTGLLHKGRGITSSLLQGKGTNLDTRQEVICFTRDEGFSTCDIRRQQPIPRSRVDVWVKIHRFDSGGTKTKRRDRACDTKKTEPCDQFSRECSVPVKETRSSLEEKGEKMLQIFYDSQNFFLVSFC
ncbi:hypothetical protein Bca52824_059655 [Brassica carinata]|uniref:Uncharacterized protein n=1 Tax=Brassica carinata TaxID=52824 RepID=A0A8X7QUW4_BRACI|nr:hypothetical protein Bca52824_059655 [Brassica carinata]